MSKNKSKKQSVGFTGFGGLELSSPAKSGAICELKNFRLLPDGSAQKRGGFSYLASVEGELRGEYPYSDGGEAVILAVVGDTLYRISADGGEPSSAQVFGTSTGKVKFFDVCGSLYIYDGEEIYRYKGGVSVALSAAMPPVYANGWTVNMYPEDIFQPLSLLTPRIMIKYRGTGDELLRLYVGQKIKSIDGIYYDGSREVDVSTTEYVRIAKDGTSIECSHWVVSNEATVFLTLDLSDYKSEDFESCDMVDVFDAHYSSRAFAYGGNDGSRVYISTPVNEADHKLAQRYYGDVAPIYFPNVSPMRFEGAEAINGVGRMYDRAVIFSDNRAWVTSDLNSVEGVERLGVVVSSISSRTGCSSMGAHCRVGGIYPITVSNGGIYRWSADPEFEDAVSLESISDSVLPALDPGFFGGAQICVNRGRNEIWFANKGSESGEVFVYGCDGKKWYLFDGVCADRLFSAGCTVAFRSGNDYYAFDELYDYDRLKDGERDIEAVIACYPVELSGRTDKRHITRAYVTCSDDGEGVELELRDDRTLAKALLLDGDRHKRGGFVGVYDLRIKSGRTESVSFRLKAGGRSRHRLYGVELVVG